MPHLIRFFSLLACMVSLSGSPVSAHELPESFFERGMSVIVRNNEARVEYRIGACELTLREQLSEWGSDADPGDLSGVIRAFCDEARESVSASIEARVDGQPVEVTTVDAFPGGQHHVTAVVVLTIKLPEQSGMHTLQIIDSNFKQRNGAVRTAFKCSGPMLRRTKHAVTLIRSERIELPSINSGHTVQAPLIVDGTYLVSRNRHSDDRDDSDDRDNVTRFDLPRQWFRSDSPPSELPLSGERLSRND